MSNLITQLSDGLAEAVEEVGRSTVRIEARRRLPASGIAWSDDGLVLTAHHVVEREDNIRVGLPDGKEAPATLVGRDPTTDVAVLRVDATGVAPAARADLESVKVGHIALAAGRPGTTVQATFGIVSALGGAWRSPSGGRVDRYLQTDVAMYPGFSGGPLADVNGAVMGLTTSALLRGVSVAIPVSSLEVVATTLVAHGRIRRGYLGVGAQPVRLPPAVAQLVGEETGLLLSSVEAGSPAEKGGLLLGDTLVAVDGVSVRHVDDLLASLAGDKIGTSVLVRFVRGGEVIERDVVIGERD